MYLQNIACFAILQNLRSKVREISPKTACQTTLPTSYLDTTDMGLSRPLEIQKFRQVGKLTLLTPKLTKYKCRERNEKKDPLVFLSTESHFYTVFFNPLHCHGYFFTSSPRLPDGWEWWGNNTISSCYMINWTKVSDYVLQ